MAKNHGGKTGGRTCFPQQIIGWILILVGVLLLFLFVPFETWLAIVGVALIVGGAALKLL